MIGWLWLTDWPKSQHLTKSQLIQEVMKWTPLIRNACSNGNMNQSKPISWINKETNSNHVKAWPKMNQWRWMKWLRLNEINDNMQWNVNVTMPWTNLEFWTITNPKINQTWYSSTNYPWLGFQTKHQVPQI